MSDAVFEWLEGAEVDLVKSGWKLAEVVELVGAVYALDGSDESVVRLIAALYPRKQALLEAARAVELITVAANSAANYLEVELAELRAKVEEMKRATR